MRRILSASLFLLTSSVAVMAFAAEACPDPSPADALLSLIPRDKEMEGWERDGPTALCHDEESLSEYIDGAAPYYLERGAVAVLFQYYQRPASGGEIKVEIYQMREDDLARLLFQEMEKGKSPSQGRELRGLGEDRHLEQALQAVWILEFYQGPFFVRLEGRGEGNETQKALLAFGSHLSHSIGEMGAKPR
ncbi:MAG: hypothetical protein QHH30_01920 [candidate division NC10 bacterium]|nr:hypothetical protein [candidate division NC10 bacterium]